MSVFRSMPLRRAVRVLGWNALLLLGALILLVLGGEAYFRLTKPFMTASETFHFVPGVGRLLKPDTEVYFTNRLDFWTVSRANRLGFLDRDPPRPAQAAASCHLTMLGDSFVEARQVPIVDKFHVQLEALAGRELPQLHVTTSAFGRRNSGQVWQLAFYDAYARSLRPKLVVLVFAPNDFEDNSLILSVLSGGWDPDRFPQSHLVRRPDGTLELRPPHPTPGRFARLPGLPEPPPPSWSVLAINKARELSWFVNWWHRKSGGGWWGLYHFDFLEKGTADVLRHQPRYARMLQGWQAAGMVRVMQMAPSGELPPVYAEALEYTAFALEQFKARAARDGARLVILASHHMRAMGPGVFDRLQGMAATLGIPVIDQAAHILRQGATLSEAQWRHDAHWNIAGHRWAAEALLEWLMQHPEVCDGAPANGAP